MNKNVFGTFSTNADAERCMRELQSELHISMDKVSYLYRNSNGNVQDATDRSDTIIESGATGASVGATVGVIAGLATVAGIIPLIGPVFAAGPLIAALGLGTGAVATTAAGAVTGAVAGGLIGALVEWGVPSSSADAYQKQLNTGEILVVVSTDEAQTTAVEDKFRDCNATSVASYASSARVSG